MKRWRRLYGTQSTFICPYCLKTYPISEATRDHKNPFARFHDSNPENIVVCCKEDNNQKGMLTYEEYMIYLLLDRVRKGQKNERDLATLDKFKRELFNIVNWSGSNTR